jgi:hypothetical protein
MDAVGSDESLDHASFVTAGSTLAAYVLVILGMAVVLFGVPYLIFSVL